MPVRDAVPADIGEITAMVLEHAAHEGSAHLCHFDAERARESIFGDDPVLRALVAVPPGDADQLAGVALWYPTFSSWAATRGIWIEDLYVRTGYRRLGLGRELLMSLRGRTAGRLEWDVHEENAEARGFYEALGAAPVTEWTKFRWVLESPP